LIYIEKMIPEQFSLSVFMTESQAGVSWNITH